MEPAEIRTLIERLKSPLDATLRKFFSSDNPTDAIEFYQSRIETEIKHSDEAKLLAFDRFPPVSCKHGDADDDF